MLAAMSEYEDQKAKLNFSSNVDFYDSTDFALLSAEVDNDAWIGSGDAMATLAVGSGRHTRSPRQASKCSRSWSRSATGASPIATASAAYGSAPNCFATGVPSSLRR